MTPQDALYNVLMANTSSMAFIAPVSWARKIERLLEDPVGKIFTLVLDNDMRISTRCEYIATVITKPHNYDKEVIDNVPRAESAEVKSVKPVGEFGEEL